MKYRVFHGSTVKGLTALRPSTNRPFPVIFFSDEPTVAASYLRGRPGKVYAATITLERPLVVDAQGRWWEDAGGEGVSTDALAYRAHQRGHDGVIIKNVIDEVDEEGYPDTNAPPNTIYAVFDAAQVKLTRRNPLVGPRRRPRMRVGETYYAYVTDRFVGTIGRMSEDEVMMDIAGRPYKVISLKSFNDWVAKMPATFRWER